MSALSNPAQNTVETITDAGQLLALLIRAGYAPEQTVFLTPAQLNLQVGFVVYPAGGQVAPHTHHPLHRHIVGTTEVLIVRKGRCRVDIFSRPKCLAGSWELGEGDIVLLASGGHAVQMYEETVLLEVKQGPYIGTAEKERFEE